MSVQEPVKVGQVRLLPSGKPAKVMRRTDYADIFGLAEDPGAIPTTGTAMWVESLPLLCPALEDLRPGDVFQEIHGRERVTLDQPDSRQRAWKLVGGGCLFPHESALGGTYRIVARATKAQASFEAYAGALPGGLEAWKAYAALDTSPPCANVSDEYRRRVAVLRDAGVISSKEAEDSLRSAASAFEIADPRSSHRTVSLPFAPGSRATIDGLTDGTRISLRVGDDGLVHVDAATKLPDWLTVGAWVTNGVFSYEVTRLDVVNGAVRLGLTYTSGGEEVVDADQRTLTRLRPCSDEEKGRVFDVRRYTNRSMLSDATDRPSARVLDGFGRKQGPVWEAYQRELAKLLEV